MNLVSLFLKSGTDASSSLRPGSGSHCRPSSSAAFSAASWFTPSASSLASEEILTRLPLVEWPHHLGAHRASRSNLNV